MGCLLKSAQKCSNLVKELKRLSNYLNSYAKKRWRPIFLCIFWHLLCKQKSVNWCTKMASDQNKSIRKMFLNFNFTAKYFWSRVIMCILHISRNLTEPYYRPSEHLFPVQATERFIHYMQLFWLQIQTVFNCNFVLDNTGFITNCKSFFSVFTCNLGWSVWHKTWQGGGKLRSCWLKKILQLRNWYNKHQFTWEFSIFSEQSFMKGIPRPVARKALM